MAATGSKHTDSDDIKVIEAVIGGDSTAFGKLIARYREPLLQYVRNLGADEREVEDIVQESLNRALLAIGSFDLSKTFSTWLYSIAHNRAVDSMRSNRIGPVGMTGSFGEERDFPQDGGSPEQDMISSQSVDVIMRNIELLPEKYREVAYLRFIRDFQYDEIARELDIPSGTVRTRISKARSLLYDSLIG